VETGDETTIGDGLTLYSQNEVARPFATDSAGLSVMENGRLVPDDFRHEHYLLIEENGKRVLISGCSHKGIANIMKWFSPHVSVGGFHFSKLPTDDTLTAAANALSAYPTEYYTCHCTGEAQYAHMKQSMPHLHYLACGDTLVI
jgi:7,8-dihydropterin-6-yl-methyl-4-(beta-D-ribofuranosyl)aminobenzene 5'-phosphate synthase